jgi:hypothetical protein
MSANVKVGVVITLYNYLDFYNLTRTARIKTVKIIRHISIPALLQPYTEIIVNASVDNTIFVHHVTLPDFSKTGIENTREVHDAYFLFIYNELKASGYVAGEIEIMQGTEAEKESLVVK